MRARFSILLALMLFILLGVLSFDPSQESFSAMQIQMAVGKPFLVLAEKETFGIYAPAGSDIEGWTPVYENRSGTTLGSFEIPHAGPTQSEPPFENPKISAPPKNVQPAPNAPLTPPPVKAADEPIDGLGIFFKQSSAVFDPVKKDKDGNVVTVPLVLPWDAEAAATLNGVTYAFGAKLDPVKEDGAFPNGVLKVARFDGKEWQELTGVSGPQEHSGKAGFWLKSVTLGDRIAVLWRGAKLDQTIGYSVEGIRIATDGDIGMCFFDGTKFTTEPITVTGLPKGNVCVWEDKGAIKCLVQTRFKGADAAETKGRMQIWMITPDGKATLAETIHPEKSAAGLFSFIAAEHFVWDNREYILRSNWQKFELWKRNPAGTWELSPVGTTGLPVFALEHKLIGALGFCGLVILLGALLGFQRRRHALTLMRALQVSDLNAPIASRAGAYLLDMATVVGLTIGVSQIFFDHNNEIAAAANGLLSFPSTALLICFMTYYTLTEWLLGATLGKFVMGLRVVSDDGTRPAFWAAFVRNAVGVLERQPMMLIVSFPMVMFSPRRQRLGDLLSRTIVVQKEGLELFLSQRAAAALRGEALEKLPGGPLENVKKKERAK